MIKGWKRALGLLTCVLMLWAFLSSGSAEKPATDKPAPAVRVLLQRLNLTDRIDLVLEAAYQAETKNGTRIYLPRGSGMTVQIRQDRLILFMDSFSMDAGTMLNLVRLQSGTETGGFRVRPYEGLYAGDLRLTVAGGQLQPVLTLSVEDYLPGVVPYEMSDSFPMEALKAQAVCARTYALSRVDASKGWDLVDTTNDQVFRGVQENYPNAARAVRETAGLVLTEGNRLINCYYSASNGGQTELPEHVWNGAESSKCFVIADDPYDLENPESMVKTARLNRDGSSLPETFLTLLREAVQALPEMKDFAPVPEAFRVDEIRQVKLTAPRYAEPSRLMTRMEITLRVSGRIYVIPETPDPLTYEEDEESTGTLASTETPVPADTHAPTGTPAPQLGNFLEAGTFTVTLPLFPAAVRALGLSIYGADNEIITVTEEADAFRLTSGRYGHGVGMSQRGAQWMASQYGKNFQEILAFYYPGAELRRAAFGAPVLPTADPVLAEAAGPAATPTPRPTLMPVNAENLPEGAWLASVEKIEDDSSLNLRAEPSPAGEILMRLYKHQRLIVLETCEDPAWVHVRTDAVEGYVMVSFLEKTEGI